ncbi:MAG: type II toxin-antitoxin system RelE/ParE family toxin [Prevotella sp.]|nr:type II toxin-antitoxin system RelE/ParE family toxin [Prevotella sp.]
MAQIKWQRRAERELFNYLLKGYIDFGETTANRFAAQVAHINDHLSKFPETGYPEPLLSEKKKLYRARLLSKRFKLIYYYSESTDTVHVADIWDMRREPSTLAKRIK